jgi:hypothetical protein
MRRALFAIIQKSTVRSLAILKGAPHNYTIIGDRQIHPPLRHRFYDLPAGTDLHEVQQDHCRPRQVTETMILYR